LVTLDLSIAANRGEIRQITLRELVAACYTIGAALAE
jgi:hypothetical protein